jgi:hypothetical protein
MNQNECQFVSLESISEGYDKTPPKSLKRHLIFFLRRHITPSQERKLYKKVDAIIDRFSSPENKTVVLPKPEEGVQVEHLKTGDMVRVKTKAEIEATLNHLRRLKGCSFMETEMTPYLGTVQRVYKHMERFVDERELKVKKSKGLILLDGVICPGTTEFGRCDRSCLLFWREEWLEKIGEQEEI